MNLVTSDFPALTLGFNPTSKDVLLPISRRRRDAGLIDKHIVFLIVITGVSMCIASLVSYYHSFNISGNAADYSRTQALVTLIVIEIAVAFSFRSFRQKTLTRSPLVNPYLFAASLLSLFVTFIAVYTPLNVLLETVPISYKSWGVAFIIALLLLLIYDIGKDINKKIRFLPTH
jgi:magnesium-transporting ATPase (P-type)